MGTPKVSVIIPAYNGKEYLAEAIQSVLDQTYPNFEIVVVDDASPEILWDIINMFSDPRVRIIRHERNFGAVAARQTGIKASSGDIIALLDQDDLFHKQKLQVHVDYLQEHPEIGLTYNARFEIYGPSREIRGLWQPPQVITLTDLVLGFPISPSDTVFRREWAEREDIWDDSFAGQAEHVIFNGQEIVFGGRLALAGCQFRNVGRALNYRRFHPHRQLSHLSERCQAELTCQEFIFNDARCPGDVFALKSVAAANIYIIWAYFAYMQTDFDLGVEYLKQAVRLNPSLLQGEPCKLINDWVIWVAAGNADSGNGLESSLHLIFDHLPFECQELEEKYSWAVARGWLLKGFHSMIWGQSGDAEHFLLLAIENGVKVDDLAVQMFVAELLDFDEEFGSDASEELLNKSSEAFEKLIGQQKLFELKTLFKINRGFRNYHLGKYSYAVKDILEVSSRNPNYLFTRGALSVLFHSAVHSIGL